MTPEQRQRIIARHRDSVLRHGHHHNALYWSSREIQELRFQILSEIGIASGDSVLDVGCGFADFYRFLKRLGIEVKYTGIDLSPDLLQKGGESSPEIELFAGDLFDFSPATESYDYVTLSGALAEPMLDDGVYAKRVLDTCYNACRKGFAFNMLNAEHTWVASRNDLQSFLPVEVKQWFSDKGVECSQRTDYLENDFSTYVYKGCRKD